MTFRPVTHEAVCCDPTAKPLTREERLERTIEQMSAEAVERARAYDDNNAFHQRRTADLLARLATAETALADRDRHFLWDERLRMEREIGDLATRLATAEAERDRLADDKARIDWFDEDHHRLESVFGACIRNEEGGDLRAIIDAERAPSTGGTPP